MKKILAAAAALLAATALSASAASFTASQKYTDGQFSDVNANSWYASSVKSAYELGFMKGTGTNQFSPSGSVTLAEAITVASRVNAIYNGKTAPENSKTGNWYDSYVSYAEANGIVEKGQFDNYARPALRSEVALIFANSLPESYFTPVNDVDRVPDVPSTNSYADELLMLYKAGVVMGSDEYGTFFPTNNIVRSEMAAIINRVALPENRLKKELILADYEDAYYHMDHTGGIVVSSTPSVEDTVWHYDNRNQIRTISNMISSLSDTSSKLPVTVWRDFNDETKGLLTLELTVSLNVLSDEKSGVYYSITDDNKNDLMKFELLDGEFLINGQKTGFKYTDQTFSPRFEMDLDKRTVDLYIDGKAYGTGYKLTDAVAGRFYAGSTVEAKDCAFGASRVILYRNYLVNEKFLVNSLGTIPDDWETTGNVTTKSFSGQRYNDNLSGAFVAEGEGTHTAKKSFNKISGNVIYETYVLLPTDGGKATVSLNSGDDVIASIIIDGDKSISGDGKELRYHRNNIWQTLRIEANTTTQTVIYKVNGKKCAESYLKDMPSFADNIVISYDATEESTMYFDDIRVFLTHEYDDYCPEPVPAFPENYDIFISMCSLWHEGQHKGWEAISAFEDKETYLGFYDEGIPEVSDWEIKYMTEHGIGIQHLCWYATSTDIKTPIRKSAMNDAIHDGFFHAKYSDLMKFMIMWENNSYVGTSVENFKEYIWNYWIDYYFTDPRYYTIDNKVVFTIWKFENFIKFCGGTVESAMELKNFMNEDIKKYGFDGVIIISTEDGNKTKDKFDRISAGGGDATYSYGWSQDGNDADKTINRIKTIANLDVLHFIPSVSVGFNNIGWVETRKPLISLEGHKKVLEYIRDEYLPAVKGEEEWHKRLVDISCWNEYGEGHYVMPSGVHGFGYLDNVREVFVGDNADMSKYNVKPTAQQKARLGHMYTGEKTSLISLDYETVEAEKKLPTETAYTLSLTSWKNGFNVEDIDPTEDLIRIVGTATDHCIKCDNVTNMNASAIDAIHIRIKVEKATTVQLFFTTKSDAIWNGAKSFTYVVEEEEVGKDVDIYFYATDNTLWKDQLHGLRLDPANNIQTTEVTAIEFLQYAPEDKAYSLTIDGVDYLPSDDITFDGSELYVPAEPIKGFFSLHNIYYEWNRYSKRLYMLSRENKSIELHVGSDIAVVDGKEVKLSKPIEAFDGIPVIPYTWFLRQLGYADYIFENKSFTLKTFASKYDEIINNRKDGKWEFEVPGDTESWSPGYMTSYINDEGYLVCTATNMGEGRNYSYDPMLTLPTTRIDPTMYSRIIVRMRVLLPEDQEETISAMYFATTSEQNLSESKTSKLTITAEEGKEFKEYIFDMSDNPSWTGTVTKLRFDPISSAGTFFIDYIRLAPSYNTEKFELVNGDISNLSKNVFYSKNGTIEFVEDSTKPGNYVINATPINGKQWTYIRQRVTYTPGATYNVAYDVRLIGTSDGNTDPTLSSSVSVNALYANAGDDKYSNHVSKNGTKISVADGWVHAKATITIDPTTTDRSFDEFTIFINPIGELGCIYQVDNIVVTEIAPQ